MRNVEYRIYTCINKFYYKHNIKENILNILEEQIAFSFLKCKEHFEESKK